MHAASLPLNWRERAVLTGLADGKPGRVGGSGAGPSTLDALVAKGLIVHVRRPGTKADYYQITAKGFEAIA